jgi:hypothetical protein
MTARKSLITRSAAASLAAIANSCFASRQKGPKPGPHGARNPHQPQAECTACLLLLLLGALLRRLGQLENECFVAQVLVDHPRQH